MSLVQAKCTNCGANLEVDKDKDAAICPFCNTPYVVEKAINNYNIKANNILINQGINIQHEIEKATGYIKLGDKAKAYKVYTKLLDEYPLNYEIRKLLCDLELEFITDDKLPLLVSGNIINFYKELNLLKNSYPLEKQSELESIFSEYYKKIKEKITVGKHDVIDVTNLYQTREYLKHDNRYENSSNAVRRYLVRTDIFNRLLSEYADNPVYRKLISDGKEIANKLNDLNLSINFEYPNICIQNSQTDTIKFIYAYGKQLFIDISGTRESNEHNNNILYIYTNMIAIDSEEYFENMKKIANEASLYINENLTKLKEKEQIRESILQEKRKLEEKIKEEARQKDKLYEIINAKYTTSDITVYCQPDAFNPIKAVFDWEYAADYNRQVKAYSEYKEKVSQAQKEYEILTEQIKEQDNKMNEIKNNLSKINQEIPIFIENLKKSNI